MEALSRKRAVDVRVISAYHLMDRAAIEGSVSIAMIEIPGIAELQIWVYIKKNGLNNG